MKRPLPPDRIKRYAITSKRPGDSRTLAFGNQGRYHFDSNEDALAHLAAVLNTNPTSKLDMFDGCGGSTLEVRPVECYAHGDAVGVWFDD